MNDHQESTVIKKGPANLERGIEAVGGKLMLTQDVLIFQSHALNIQCGRTEIPCSEILKVEPSWSRFLGAIPLVPNGLKVHTRDGTVYRFVVFGRRKWIAAIEHVQPMRDVG